MSKISENRIIVYESPTAWDRMLIEWYLIRGFSVWVIEPVYAYHYTKKVHFLPRHFPSYVDELINQRKIGVLSIQELNAKPIFFEAGDKAVETVESVFGMYRKDCDHLLEFVSRTVKSRKAENAFKTDFCNRLAEFYSLNILLGRVKDIFPDKEIIFFPRANVRLYKVITKVVRRCKIAICPNEAIRFPLNAYVRGWMEYVQQGVVVFLKVLIQFLGGLFFNQKNNRLRDKKNYLLGMAVASPGRQLKGNKRGPDFLIDYKKIFPKDIIYFCRDILSSAQIKCLNELPGDNCLIPRLGRFYSHPAVWGTLLRFIARKKFLCNLHEIETASLVLFNYFVWQEILTTRTMKHFVTHCDFGAPHIGRNIALNEGGVETWYYTDSMNFTANFYPDKGRHPFWTYLYYDHFVTWDEAIVEYFQKHHLSVPKLHVVGCLWAGNHQETAPIEKKPDSPYIIAAFDTGYTSKGFGCFEEGVAFAKDLIRLAEEFQDIVILWKPKVARRLSLETDTVFGEKLVAEYRNMDIHSRIRVFDHQESPADVMRCSDLVISFPFTSTTYETLSMNKPAFWHDPFGYYRNTPYGQMASLTTHHYDELREKVGQLKGSRTQAYVCPIPLGSPLFDPYRDGKAVERFRDILLDVKTREEVHV